MEDWTDGNLTLTRPPSPSPTSGGDLTRTLVGGLPGGISSPFLSTNPIPAPSGGGNYDIYVQSDLSLTPDLTPAGDFT